ncbi:MULTISPECIES: NAD(P)-binding domain-containing protein [unclassified Pseudofrankia]|uniref:NAD(P)-binding domain-containing protein n=1 Tax=unclassified Pseudofrankia TaxID=2994372 RepID=UPI0008D95FD2|nr:MULTISPECIES: NAD(P)-binding domain-containing protein [unclassified Pseudofrankia]MDT3445410.1 NAD(P)-binding domain-containing protein [Pseudofrankia sp. BMG5.37]
MKIGFLGVGSMGRPMLEQVVKAGFQASFYARRPEVAREIETSGVISVPTIAALAATSDVVVVCVFSDQQVREVCGGDEGLLTSMRPGSVIVIHTTCSPDTAPALAEAGRSRDIRILDAAFSGGPADAAASRVTLLVGGEPRVLEAVRPVLAAYASPILHIGGLGDGQRVKLVNNALFGANVGLVAEAERVARELGLDPARALDAISHCSGNSYALGTVRALGSSARLQEAAGRYITKDVATAKALAAAAGTQLGLLATAADVGQRPVPPSVQALWDIEQIKQLKARYFRYLDLKDWDAFRDLFTADCKHYLPIEGEKRFQLNEEYFESTIPMLDNGVTTHHGHMPEITLLGDTEAEGVWSMFDYVQLDGPQGRLSIKGYGHYIETYRKCPDGQWRISSKRNNRQRFDHSAADG